jgi:hypothetical protein
MLPAIASCSPKGNACSAAAVATGLWASYRKDSYLPDAAYAEQGAAPTTGGRFHVAAIAQVSGSITDVKVGGQSLSALVAAKSVEWWHAWPQTVTKGQPIWVAFHSRSAAWDSAASGDLVVTTDQGTAVTGSFPVAKAVVPITYVTTSADLSSLLVHVKNVDTSAHELSGLLVDGVDVLAADVACVPKKTLAPGETALFTVPLCTPAKPGVAWTVVATLKDGPASVGVGRVQRPFFPVEAWAATSDCAFPGGTGSTYDAHVKAGFDTQYMYWSYGNCGVTGAVMANQTAPKTPGLHLLLGDDFLSGPNPDKAITDTSATIGFLTGDESDGEVYDSSGLPNAQKTADTANKLWSYYPELTTYNGGKTNKNVGTFAGMTDVQGMDFYAAACAPHITQFGTAPPLRGPYDYLKNTRDNHMPLPTWLYAQGLFGGWNKNLITKVHVQPDPQELLVQALRVVAAGGKGMMWFQTSQAEAEYAPARWKAIGDANWMIRGVRDRLREGDVTGQVTFDDKTLAEAIRARDAIVVPVLNLDPTSGPTDLGCQAILTESMVPHYVLATRTTTVSVTVPDDLAVVDVFEVTGSGVVDPGVVPTAQGRNVTFSNVPLSNAQPVRLFVLASTKSVRTDVMAAMAH